MQPDQQQRIMGYFIEEAQEHLNTIEQGLLNLQDTIDDPEAANEMFRAAHSVKGGAAMLGLTSIQQTAHRLEDYFKILKENPVQADQTLETHFLKGYDALAALIQQLQASGGLVDSETQPITSAAEENFAQLQQHLDNLTKQETVASSVRATNSDRSPSVASTQEESALLLTFRSDVPDRLRQMLQLFKQQDTPETRSELQRICADLQRVGDQFELPAWSALLKAAQQAVGNSENTYRRLAPVLIKEIKQAQDLVVAGQEASIVLSPALQDLLPTEAITDASATDLDFADLLDEGDDPSLTNLDLPNFESDLSNTDDVDLPMGFDEISDQEPSLPGFSSSQLSASDDLPGPEVGIAELNSLADLFEGENLDLGSTWQNEDLVGDDNLFGKTSSSDDSSDFDDLLFDDDSPAEASHSSDQDLGFEEEDSFLDLSDEQSDSSTAPLDEIPEPSPIIPQTSQGGISPEQSEAVDMALDNLGELFSGLDEAELAADGLIPIELTTQDQEMSLGDEDFFSQALDQPTESTTSEEADDAAIADLLDEGGFGSPSDESSVLPTETDDPDLDLDEFLGEPTSEAATAADDSDLDWLDESDLTNSSNPEGSDLDFSGDLDALEAEDDFQPLSTQIDLSRDLDQDLDADLTDSSDLDTDLSDLSLEASEAGLDSEPVLEMEQATASSEVDEVSDLLNLAGADDDSNFAAGSDIPTDEAGSDLGLDLILDETGEGSFSDLDATDAAPDPQTEPTDALDELDFSAATEGGEPDAQLAELFDQPDDLGESDEIISDQSLDEPAFDPNDSSFELDQLGLDDLNVDEGLDLAPETSDDLNFDVNFDDPNESGDDDRQAGLDLLGLDDEVHSESLAAEDGEANNFDGDFDLDQIPDATDSSSMDDLDGAFETDLFGGDEDSSPAEDSSDWDNSSDFSDLDEIPDLQMDDGDGSLEFSDLANLTEATPETDEELGLGDADLESFGETPQVTFDPIGDDDLFGEDSATGDLDLGDQNDDWGAEDELGGDSTEVGSIPDETLIELSQETESGDVDSLDIEGLLDDDSNFDSSEDTDLDTSFDFSPEFDVSSEIDEFDGASAETSDLGDFGDFDDLVEDGDVASATESDLDSDLDLDFALDGPDLDLDDSALDVGEESFSEDGVDFSQSLAEEASDLDSLDSLLSDDLDFDDGTTLTGTGLTSDEADAFSDLDSLLDGSVAASSAATAESSNDGNDGFDDLDKLLEDANSKLGGPPAIAPRGAASRQPRRSVIEQTMRVPVKQLDNLSNLVGEMVVNRNSLEQDQERLRQFLDNLLYQVQQLSDVGQRMRDLYERSLLESSLLASRQSYQIADASDATRAAASHATGADFDALEMDRFTAFHSLSQEMIELIVRVRESASDIEFIINEPLDQVTRNFRQVTTQLQEGLTRARMVPFSLTADRLPRGVRDNAIKEGKQAELVVEGRDTLIDKMILEQLTDPLNHLVNNAVAHGVERPDARQAAGKNPVGRITVRAFHQGNQTVISVSDDGAGIDPERIKAKAIEKGLITPAEASTMSRLDVYDLLFRPGFSGAEKVTDLAGRGVGMDVVRTSLNEIRGTISIDSSLGRGTSFTIRLPLTLSISKALCCISNRARIAFPMDGVEDMLDVPRERIQTNAEGQECIAWRDMQLPFKPLADVLKYNRSLGRGSVYGGSQEDDIISIVVLRSAGNYTALQVDQVMGEYEIVIKQLEGPVPKPIGIAGATVLGDGRIMPIADVLELIDLCMGRIQDDKTWEPTAATPNITVTIEDQDKREPTVLIVDDSITVRELLSMTFSKVGYRVEQARDGQDAWEKLRSGLPCDIVFCDIEMPRMDGLELLSRIQKEPSLGQLPIAMLTSRGADRHRQMAIQMGARGYFTKPYLEEVLLDAAQRMLKGEVLVTANG